MKIIIGKSAGFCYGVNRAVQGAEKELQKCQSLYCLGELVHNQDIIQKLENKGLKIISNIEQAKGRCIIRAHGEPKETYEKAKNLNLELIDFTCQNVLKNHKIVEEYFEKGYFILLLGDQKHPENIGTISYCNGYGMCANANEEIEKAISHIKKENISKILILAQTTYSSAKFDEYANYIEKELRECKEIKVLKTICNATEIRQKETEEIAKKVEYMIIVGGENSSNTRKLYDIAKTYCKNVMLVKNINEIDKDQIQRYNIIGIMAGASTPSESFKIVKF